MTWLWIPILRGVFLVTAIFLIAYSVATPGVQAWHSLFGGMLGMWSITFQSFEKRP